MLQKRTRTAILVGLLLLCVPLTLNITAAETKLEERELTDSRLTPKGIYHAVEEFQRTGVKFLIELQGRGKKPRRVPVSHEFRTGDRFTLTYEINRDSYIYVINQTIGGDTRYSSRHLETTSAGFQSKRVERVYHDRSTAPAARATPPRAAPPRATSPRKSPRSSYSGLPRLLFPTAKAGSNNRLRKDRPYRIPTRGHYVMDEQTGIERLFVVLSERRLDLSDYFETENGRIRGPEAAARLRDKLRRFRQNAEVELVEKGISHEIESYGVTIDPEKPAVVEIDLRHCR